ncbi:hypothetical protein Acr_13g0008880 [Actinidia rufa]|uniref:Uncharacterized protein n=1 Tax=Actinidia rufa TaxID=165716 RepID=A0A7J0FL89_9ERIC|nr:hypothetical protein Acr_13g0008880 [Actinidia rufa]
MKLSLVTSERDKIGKAHAFKSLTEPRTGIPYDGHAPASLDGVRISAVRLQSGSLRTRGFSKFKEFSIPIGVAEQPYVERLVLVYHNLGNWSSLFYPLLATTFSLQFWAFWPTTGQICPPRIYPIGLRASEKPIVIRFRDLKLGQNGSSMTCVWFDLDGSVEFDNVVDGDVFGYKTRPLLHCRRVHCLLTPTAAVYWRQRWWL